MTNLLDNLYYDGTARLKLEKKNERDRWL